MENKVLLNVLAPTMRELTKKANELEIQKDEIISILKDNGQFVMTYWR